MTSLIPRSGSSVISSLPDGFSRSEGRQLNVATNRVVARGIVANTELSVANFLTTTAIQHTTALVKQVYALADGDEYLASRLGALVDGYVGYARDQLSAIRRIG